MRSRMEPRRMMDLGRSEEGYHSPVANDTTAAHRELRLSLHAHLAGILKKGG